MTDVTLTRSEVLARARRGDVVQLACALNTRLPQFCRPTRQSWPAVPSPDAFGFIDALSTEQLCEFLDLLDGDPRVRGAGIVVRPVRRPPTFLEAVRGVHCCQPGPVAVWRRFQLSAAFFTFVGALAAIMGIVAGMQWLTATAPLAAAAVIGALFGVLVYCRSGWLCPGDHR